MTNETKSPCTCRQPRTLTVGYATAMLLSALVGAGVRHALDTPKFDAIGAGLEQIGDQLDRVCKQRAMPSRRPVAAKPDMPAASAEDDAETPKDFVSRGLDHTQP